MQQQPSFLPSVTPPHDLQSRILGHIWRAQRRNAWVRISVLSTGALFALALLIPAVRYTAAELYTSGFFEFAAILAKSPFAFSALWQEYALALLESIPALALILVLAAMGSFVWTTARLTRSIKEVRNPFSIA